MSLPTHLVELQFGSSGYVDVTSVTNNVSINKGISRQLEDFSAGTLSISFTNNDRTFDPTNASSILWYNSNPNQISNYDFETNTSGWISGANALISRSTAKAYSGVASLKVSSNTGNADYWANNTVYSAVTAGQSYSASAYVQSETYSTRVHIRIDWYNSLSALISTSESNDFYVNSSSWTKVIISDIAPSGAVNAIVTFRNFSVTSGSESMFWDNVYFQSNASPNAYSIVQPGGKVRVTANGIRRFTGFIQTWDFTYDEAGLNGNAIVSALDEMFRVSNARFSAGFEPLVQDTGSRFKQVMSANGFDSSEYSLVNYGKTIVGADVHNEGDNVLSYLQNVARSEPADLFANASGVMVMKDRTFGTVVWNPTLVRQNQIAYPSEITKDTTDWFNGNGFGNGWINDYQASTATFFSYGGTSNVAQVYPSANITYFQYVDVNQPKYNSTNATAQSYVFSAYFKGNALASSGNGLNGSFALLDSAGNTINSGGGSALAINITGTSNATWYLMRGTASASTGIVAGVNIRVSSPGTASTTSQFVGHNWHVENASTWDGNYFDGYYNPYTSTASTVYVNAWAGLPWQSFSGVVRSVSSAIAAPTILTFADQNSQGTAYGNGTALPFTDLYLAYGGEQMYNSISVVGVNATATAKDTALISLYGLREWAQTDNLTTTFTQPQTIANNYLSAFKYPEYRAQEITVALEGLTTAQQNQVLAIELRDVIRVCFQPSAIGSVIDKYYEILAIDSQTDNERHHIKFTVASLEHIASF